MIGPSGAGKSTLLGVLAGRKARGEVGGCVRLNGRRASPAVRREMVGYVTQDDVLPGTSTVAEHLHFHARLRLPWLSRSAHALLVARTLACLQLTSKAERLIGDQFVRGLSGGERRRVSAATELLAVSAGASGLVLLDEPLSGLDSWNAALLTNALVELTTAGAPAPRGAAPPDAPRSTPGLEADAPEIEAAQTPATRAVADTAPAVTPPPPAAELLWRPPPSN